MHSNHNCLTNALLLKKKKNAPMLVLTINKKTIWEITITGKQNALRTLWEDYFDTRLYQGCTDRTFSSSFNTTWGTILLSLAALCGQIEHRNKRIFEPPKTLPNSFTYVVNMAIEFSFLDPHQTLFPAQKTVSYCVGTTIFWMVQNELWWTRLRKLGLERLQRTYTGPQWLLDHQGFL